MRDVAFMCRANEADTLTVKFDDEGYHVDLESTQGANSTYVRLDKEQAGELGRRLREFAGVDELGRRPAKWRNL
jgi:hypothetical protein